VGAEGVTTSLGDLATTYANNLQSEEDQLASSATAQQFAAEQAAEGASQSLSNLLYGQGSDQQKLALSTGEQNIQNTESEMGQQTNKGLSLAELGTGYNAVPGYQNAANAYNTQGNVNNAGTGQLFDALGNLIPQILPSTTPKTTSLAATGITDSDYGY
jgi:hypothetical protein